MLDKATEQSKTTGKLLALAFLNDPSDKDAIKSISDKKITSLAKDFVFAKTKFENDSDLAKKFKVNSASLVLIDTLRDKSFRTAKFDTDEIEKALKACQPSEPKWEKDLNKASQSVKERPALVLFTDDKEGSKTVISLLSSRMLSALLGEVTCCKAGLDSKEAKEWKIEKAPTLVVITERFSAKDNVEVLTLDGIRKAITGALHLYCEWKCQNDKCIKVSDEPGECCGKEMKKTKKGSNNPHPAVARFECKTCGTKSAEQKECCKQPMTKIVYKLYKCQECGHTAKEEKACCKRPMTPVESGQK